MGNFGSSPALPLATGAGAGLAGAARAPTARNTPGGGVCGRVQGSVGRAGWLGGEVAPKIIKAGRSCGTLIN